MALDFRDVLAGQARRMRHHDCERAIDARASCGVAHVAQAHHARREFGGMRRAKDRVEDFERARSREADNRDGAEAGRGGGGYDRVGEVHSEKED